MEQDPIRVYKTISKQLKNIQDLTKALSQSLQDQIERNESLQEQIDSMSVEGNFNKPFPFTDIVPSNTQDSSYASFYNPFVTAGKVVAQIKLNDTSKDPKFNEILTRTVNILTAKVSNKDLLLQNAEKALKSATELQDTASFKDVKEVATLVKRLIRNITNYTNAAKDFVEE